MPTKHCLWLLSVVALSKLCAAGHGTRGMQTGRALDADMHAFVCSGGAYGEEDGALLYVSSTIQKGNNIDKGPRGLPIGDDVNNFHLSFIVSCDVQLSLDACSTVSGVELHLTRGEVDGTDPLVNWSGGQAATVLVAVSPVFGSSPLLDATEDLAASRAASGAAEVDTSVSGEVVLTLPTEAASAATATAGRVQLHVSVQGGTNANSVQDLATFWPGESSSPPRLVLRSTTAGCDADNDGVEDDLDRCVDTPADTPTDATHLGCSTAQLDAVDADRDGVCTPGAVGASPLVCTGTDNCPNASNADQDPSACAQACGVTYIACPGPDGSMLAIGSGYSPKNAYSTSTNLGAVRVGDAKGAKTWNSMITCNPLPDLLPGQTLNSASIVLTTDLSNGGVSGANPLTNAGWSATGPADIVCDASRQFGSSMELESSDSNAAAQLRDACGEGWQLTETSLTLPVAGEALSLLSSTDSLQWRFGLTTPSNGNGQPDFVGFYPSGSEHPPVMVVELCGGCTDDDSDLVCNGDDACPNTLPAAPVNSLGCGADDVDNDGDGVCDPGTVQADGTFCSGEDACNGTGSDVNSLGCVAGDVDEDGDGVCDFGTSLSDGSFCTGADVCLGSTSLLVNTFGCTQADVDYDSDGVCDPGAPTDGTYCTGVDECATESAGHCGSGNGCPTDSDNDGVVDCDDKCPGHPDNVDDDEDSVPNACDSCPETPASQASSASVDGCSREQRCAANSVECELARVVVLTDLGAVNDDPVEFKDRDDQQSLVRLLVYQTEFDLQLLVATTSWSSFPGPKEGYGQLFPETIHDAIDQYAEAYPNLSAHGDGFKTPAQLHAMVRTGCAAVGVTDFFSGDYFPVCFGEGKSSEASNAIIDLLEDDDPRPIWFLGWGKMIELAQALWDMINTLGWSDEDMVPIIAKIRVYDISGQDNVGAWIPYRFPETFYIRATHSFIGMYQKGDTSTFNEAFLQNHVWGHSALGDWYPSTTLSHTVAEGDTPSFLYLLSARFGLTDVEEPFWHGWGGKFTLQSNPGKSKFRPFYMFDDDPTFNPQNLVAEWRPEFQNDFQARMDWCFSDKAEDVNYAPVAVLNSQSGVAPVYLTASPGGTIALSAAGSADPDGDALTYSWTWDWKSSSPQASTPEATVAADGASATVTLPASASEGDQHHIILRVVDDGSPALTRYRRAVIDIE